MKMPLRILIVASIAASSAVLCFSYTKPRWPIGGYIKQSRWPVPGTIPILVNTSYPNRIQAGSQPFEAVRNMFERRSLHTTLRFSLSQGTFPESIGFDGTNLVTFKDTVENRSAAFGFAAVAWFWWSLVDDEPVLVESDIVFGPTVPSSTTGAGGVDIESLGGHELTHFLSCDHSSVMAAVGFPTYFTEVPNERNLALDDLAAGNLLYPFPEIPSTTGALSGFVEKPGGATVFGAHVVATRQADGAPVGDISVTGGHWHIEGLPPGQYTLYVEPLDGPSEPSNTLLSGLYTSEPADVDFETTIAGGRTTPTVYTVLAGAETAIGTIVVSAPAGPLNLRRTGLPGVRVGASAVNMFQGSSGSLTILGPGVDNVPDNGVSVSGPGVTVSSAGVLRGYAGDPYMIVPVSIASDAEPGARTIFADDGAHVAALTGSLEIHPWSPYPNLLRNDQITSLTPITPGLGAIFPLDPTGPDNFLGTGEGVLREFHGSDDDDDLYAPQIESGFMDPDLDVVTDNARPLVFYQLDDPNRTLFLAKSSFGRIVVTYTDAP